MSRDTEIGADWLVRTSIAEQINGYDLQATLDERWDDDDIAPEIAPGGDAVHQGDGGIVTKAMASDLLPAPTPM